MRHNPGIQLEGQELYKRQKQLRSQTQYPLAPRIIATHLHVPDNLGSVLRLADAAGSSAVIFIGATELDHKRIHKTARNCESLIPFHCHNRSQRAQTITKSCSNFSRVLHCIFAPGYILCIRDSDHSNEAIGIRHTDANQWNLHADTIRWGDMDLLELVLLSEENIDEMIPMCNFR